MAVEGPLGYGFYGMVWGADSLGNLQVGDTISRVVDYFFRADASFTCASARVFFIFSSTKPGYQLGTGGQIKIDLCANATGTTPGAVLATHTVTDPLAAGFRLVTFNATTPIVDGTIYHLRFTNVDPSPAANWVSMDDMHYDTAVPAGTQIEPAIPDADMGTMYRDGAGSWVRDRHHAPVFTLFDTAGNGHGPGIPYVNPRSQSGIALIGGASQAGSQFTPTQDVTVTAIYARVEKVGAPAAGLTFKLRQGGTVVETVTVTAAGVPVTANATWVRATLPAPRVLTAGVVHRVELSSPGSTTTDGYSTFRITPDSGFASPWQFPGPQVVSTNSGGTFTTPDGDHAQIFFSTATVAATRSVTTRVTGGGLPVVTARHAVRAALRLPGGGALAVTERAVSFVGTAAHDAIRLSGGGNFPSMVLPSPTLLPSSSLLPSPIITRPLLPSPDLLPGPDVLPTPLLSNVTVRKGSAPRLAVTGGGTVTIATSNVRGRVIVLSGGGFVTVATGNIRNRTVSLSGGGLLVVAAGRSPRSATSVTGGGTVVVSVRHTAPRAVTITGGGQATVTLSRPATGAEAIVLSGGGLPTVAAGRQTTQPTATVTGGGTVTIAATRGARAVMVVTGGGTVTATAWRDTPAVVTVTGGGDAALDGFARRTVTVTVTGGGPLLATLSRGAFDDITLTGGGDLRARAFVPVSGPYVPVPAGRVTPRRHGHIVRPSKGNEGRRR